MGLGPQAVHATSPCLGIALFFPGIPEASDPSLLIAGLILVTKLGIGGFFLALIETLSAKMRIFRAPDPRHGLPAGRAGDACAILLLRA